MKLRFATALVMEIIAGSAVCSMLPLSARAAGAGFDTSPLPAIAYSSFFSNGANDYDIDIPIKFSIIQKPQVDKYIQDGIEIRIFSLQPTDADVRNGTAGKTQPKTWGTVDNCLVYLSLVFRPDRGDLLNRHEIDLGPLKTSAGWLSVLDHNQLAPGYYRLVIEPATKDDEPQYPDAGGLRGYYEFIRLTNETKDGYFNQGLYFRVKPPTADNGAGQASDIGKEKAEIDKEAAAFKIAADKISASLHCYRANPVRASAISPATQLAGLEPCEPERPGTVPTDFGAFVYTPG